MVSVKQHVDHIRTLTDLPVCVGFGIKDGASARAVADLSDGVVVGSVLVSKMAELAARGEASPRAFSQAVSSLVAEMRDALDN